MIPIYEPTRITKVWASARTGLKGKELSALLGVENKTWRSFGHLVPAPYADRLFLSDWGKLPITPRFVTVSDALIIFKKIPLLARHFKQRKEWLNDKLFLPELESAFMIRHFKTFMLIFTEEEIKERYYR